MPIYRTKIKKLKVSKMVMVNCREMCVFTIWLEFNGEEKKNRTIRSNFSHLYQFFKDRDYIYVYQTDNNYYNKIKDVFYDSDILVSNLILLYLPESITFLFYSGEEGCIFSFIYFIHSLIFSVN